MIRVQRKRRDPSGKWIYPPKKWISKASAASKKAIREGSKHKFVKQVISDATLRATLEELFYGKCAYCESDLEEVGWDVEHFRPKGRIAGTIPLPGYYWLAYKWHNLFASCKTCNQSRRDPPIWGDLRYESAGGKLDQFPLGNEKTRARKPTDDISREAKLLLDPCSDYPETHLTYDPTGQIFPLKKHDRRARTTIDVFRLDKRRRLIRRRKRAMDCVARYMKRVAALASKGRKAEARSLRQCVWETLCSDGFANAGAARAVWADPERFGI